MSTQCPNNANCALKIIPNLFYSQCELGLKVFDLLPRELSELSIDRYLETKNQIWAKIYFSNLCVSLFHLSAVVKRVVDLISKIMTIEIQL